jgi:outer membrane protein
MKKTLLAASVAALLSVPVQADMLFGLYIGGEVWDTAPSGTFGQVDNMVDFGLEGEQQTSFHVALEHPIPLIPNVRIASTTLNTVGAADVVNYEFGGITFDGQATTDVDVSFIDYTLYYEILDNDLTTLDIGLTARDFSGDMSVSSIDETADLEVSLVMPMVYASVIFGLPFTGLNIFAQGNLTSYDDQTIYDVQAGISYALLDNLAVDLDINLGYRMAKLDVNDLVKTSADLTYDGAYLGATVHF